MSRPTKTTRKTTIHMRIYIDEPRRNDAHELQLTNDISRDASEVFGSSSFLCQPAYLFFIILFSPFIWIISSSSFIIFMARSRSWIPDLLVNLDRSVHHRIFTVGSWSPSRSYRSPPLYTAFIPDVLRRVFPCFASRSPLLSFFILMTTSTDPVPAPDGRTSLV